MCVCVCVQVKLEHWGLTTVPDEVPALAPTFCLQSEQAAVAARVSRACMASPLLRRRQTATSEAPRPLEC